MRRPTLRRVVLSWLAPVVVLASACFDESPPIETAAGDESEGEDGGDDLPATTSDEETADDDDDDETRGDDEDDTDGDTGGDDDDDETGAASTGAPQCEPVDIEVPATSVPADIVIAVDDSLGPAGRAQLSDALAAVAATWEANDAHFVLVAPSDVMPPWDDDCATGTQLEVDPGEPRHPLVLLADHFVAGDFDCALRAAGTASRHYAVVSGRDPLPAAAMQFNDEVFEDEQVQADARFHAGFATTCGEAGASLVDLAVFGCGIAVDVCAPDAAQTLVETLGTPRAACEYAPQIPPGHTLDELTLAVEIPSLGATLDMVRVGEAESCTEVVDPGNLPREWYVEDGRVHLCTGACCLAQTAVVDDLRLHELWTCEDD